jgi:hypothetical protein
MTGKPMAGYILATARDGYAVVFASQRSILSSWARGFSSRTKRNGGPLPGPQQPLQMIAPQDKLHARSVYSLAKIEIGRLHP